MSILVTGGAGYIGIWIYTFKSAWGMRHTHPEFMLALLSYETAITFLSHTYMLYPYILLGLTVSAAQFYSRREEAPALFELRDSLLTKEYI